MSTFLHIDHRIAAERQKNQYSGTFVISSPPPAYPPGLKPPPADDIYVEEINDDLYVDADLAVLEAGLPPPMYGDDDNMVDDGDVNDESTEDEDSDLDDSDDGDDDSESLQMREQELIVNIFI